jgi:hypothetical protein
MRRLTTGKVLSNASLGDSVVVRTSHSVLTQPQTVQPTVHYAIRYSLLLLGYKPVQHVTVLNTVGSCNTAVRMYYSIISYSGVRYIHSQLYQSPKTKLVRSRTNNARQQNGQEDIKMESSNQKITRKTQVQMGG